MRVVGTVVAFPDGVIWPCVYTMYAVRDGVAMALGFVRGSLRWMR